MLTTHSSLPNQAVAMARTDSQEMHTLLTCAEPVQLQQADPAMLKSMAAVGVLGVKTRQRIPRVAHCAFANRDNASRMEINAGTVSEIPRQVSMQRRPR